MSAPTGIGGGALTLDVSSPTASGVIGRFELRGRLVAVSDLRVGASGPAAVGSDLVAARDGSGRVVIPGSSLAGALRAWLRGMPDRYAKGDLDAVFGSLEERTQNGTVCRLVVHDAVALGEPAVDVRNGVGIDRRSGSAAARLLYEQEVVRRGAEFEFHLVGLLTHATGDVVRRVVHDLADGLVAGRLHVGAGRSRGLGTVRLDGAQLRELDLTRVADLSGWLLGTAAWEDHVVADGSRPLPSDGVLGVEITWTPVTPVVVRSSRPGEHRGVEAAVPLRLPQPDGAESDFLIPGTSLKGALRTHAERIVRTLRGLDIADSPLEQLSAAGLETVHRLFGRVGEHAKVGEVELLDGGRPRQLGRRGALGVEDCLGRAEGGAVGTRPVTHVAIDRWAGGAAEHLLYTVCEPDGVVWDPITLRIDSSRFANAAGWDSPEAALVLLLLVLRDLGQGWIPLGSGTTRGNGAIAVSQVRFDGGVSQPWACLVGRTLDDVLGDPPPEVIAALRTWRSLVEGDTDA